MKYKTKIEKLKLKKHEIKIECLEDLNSTIDELFGRIDNGEDPTLLEDLCPYFGVFWPAAKALCEQIEQMGATFEGAKVLEIGCGLAAPSLLLEKFHAKVLATDFHPEVPLFLNRNMKHNHCSRVEYLHHNWTDISPEALNALKPYGPFDWIVGSDVLYEKHHPETLASALAVLSGKNGRIILSDPMRPYLQNFVDAMKERGFRYDEVFKTIDDSPTPKEVMILIMNKGV